jgi:hypothetical protein
VFLLLGLTIVWPPLFLAYLAAMGLFMLWARWYSIYGGNEHGAWSFGWSSKGLGRWLLQDLWGNRPDAQPGLHDARGQEGMEDGERNNENGENVVNPLDSGFRRS